MKCAILAGGRGSRLSEETHIKPKPMVEIGGHPILWHILKHYAGYGFEDFYIALGYKGYVLKKYITDYHLLAGDLSVSIGSGSIDRLSATPESWQVSLIDTGENTMTGGRIKRLKPYLSDGTFMLTWGDGVSDVDLRELLKFHRSHGKYATLTAVHPPARFGHLELNNEQVTEFSEKPQTREGWINGAFFVLEPEIFDYIDGDETAWEHKPLENLAKDGQLMAYKHRGFWQCMDTLRDKLLLEKLWETGNAPWRTWF